MPCGRPPVSHAKRAYIKRGETKLGEQGMRVVVTGASGFVGRPCCVALTTAGHDVTAVVRASSSTGDIEATRVVPLGDLTGNTDWSGVLAGADAVVHLVARTHVLNEQGHEAEALYKAANVDVLSGLAEAAARAGVKRLVFVSSIKVNGEATYGRPFAADDEPAPEDAYGRSKTAAEQRLREIAAQGGMEFVILRPPLMYGLGVRGNMARLFSFVDRGLPLPLASIRNARDILSVGAFADLIVAAVAKPGARNRIFLACDGTPVSTPALVEAIAAALGRKARLVPFPVSMLTLAGSLTGRQSEVERLIGDLEIDDGPTRTDLGWKPRLGMAEALAETARWFRTR
jgi:nucleoside-diphosphate-sugar epimerase